MASQELEESKYPPAKPGALGFEPLKAAWGAAYAARFLIPKVPLRKNNWHVEPLVTHNSLFPDPNR